MKNQITELLTNYGPIAGIWLDGIGTPISNLDLVHQFKVQELYDHIHALQPHTLVSYKQACVKFDLNKIVYKAIDVEELIKVLDILLYTYIKNDVEEIQYIDILKIFLNFENNKS